MTNSILEFLAPKYKVFVGSLNLYIFDIIIWYMCLRKETIQQFEVET